MKSKDMKRGASTIYAELGQTKPFDCPQRELAVVVMRTGDVLHHSIARALAPSGLSNEQYNALRILRGSGEEGRATLELSSRLISRSPNITRLLDKLIDKGLAIRERCTIDRRQALIRITPAGREQLERCDRAVDAVLSKMKVFSADEVRIAVEVLDRLRGAVAVTTVSEEQRARKTID